MNCIMINKTEFKKKIFFLKVIKCVAEGKPVPNRPLHLTRAISGHSNSGMGSRVSHQLYINYFNTSVLLFSFIVII